MEKNINIKYDVPFTMIDSAILLSENLSVYQKTVYCILCAYASNADKSCYPSYSTIAKKAGCSRKKAIDTISELTKLGFVEKQEQTNAKGENISNIYHIRACPPKTVDNSPIGGVQDIPRGSECDIPPGKPDTPGSVQGTPKLYPKNYKEFNYNQSITEPTELDEILENCEIDGLNKEKDRDLFRQAITTMYQSEEIKVCGNIYPQAVVRKNMRKLNYEVIAYAFDTLKAMDAPPKSPINYLVSVLYRGIFEAD